MHNKIKGNVGELYTAAFFAEKGFSVFSELGDNSSVDLIVISPDGNLTKIQCKAATPRKTGSISLYVIQSGPNGYKRKYTKEEIDLFSLYDIVNNELYLIPSDIALSVTSQFAIRFLPAKNGQQKCNKAADYKALVVFEKLWGM